MTARSTAQGHAAVIRDETTAGANTASRVGINLREICDNAAFTEDLTEALLRTLAAALTASLAVNSQKITGLANGSASSDAAAFGQIAATALSAFAVPTGSIAMNSQKLTGLAAGTGAGDSVRYEQVVRIDGTNAFTGDQSMGSHKLTNVTDGTSAQDAATFNMLRTVRSPTAKAHTDSPYSLAATDEILQLDTSTGTIQVNLPAPSGKQIFLIKDVGGAASTSNITLHRNSTEKIENTASDKTLTLNFGAWMVWSDGTNWWISGSP